MEIKQVFKWGTTLFSVLPGVAVLLTSIGLPPGYPRVLCGGIIEAIGVFTLLHMRINGDKIRTMPRQKANRIATTFLLLFLISLLLYFFLYGSRFVHNIDYDTTLFFPLWYTHDLDQLIIKAGGRNAAISSYGPAAILSLIEDAPAYLHLTKLLLLTLYIFLLEVLIIAMSFVGFRAAGRRSAR